MYNKLAVTALILLVMFSIGPGALADPEPAQQAERPENHQGSEGTLAPAAMAQDVLSDPSYQRVMAPRSKHPRGQSMRLSGSGGGRGGGGGASSLVSILAWLAIGSAICMIALWLAASLGRRKSEIRAQAQEQADPAGQTRADPSLARIKQLAAEGRYSEAVHSLFLLAVSRLAARRSREIGGSLTARELIRSLPQNEHERQRFSLLVSTVESSLFGGQSVTASDWAGCDRAFEELFP